ncbi:MAG: phenylalanine--tRNA ligase subunit beta [Microbacteriaceae bacterium]|jgi:phenylalanyl-tRNA synthetase beta chain|nr:phenylalanine--tRNA ligase subunit beta [Microbacteriaceae bacterium]MCI1207072.1 phenylalanine--tRNA ligase subunit beta [Microbacteriaceae bacterium]
MRVPLSWLAESVELQDRDPERVLAALVRVGLEEEDVHRFSVSGPVVCGQVLSREPEPQTNGKTINWCQVRVAPDGQRAADGGDPVRGIVCGAHNFEVGDKTVVTLPGSVLPGDFRISARKTYGHLSDGMMASARELGLGADHSGIVVLSRLGLDPEPGTPLLGLLGLDDVAVEINITPDRGYCFSIRGVAREYAHSTGAAFTDPAGRVRVQSPKTPLPIRVDDAAPIRGNRAVRSFATRLVTGVDATAPTPAWMLSRLTLAGLRSVSLPVDITNYVMLELGQPLHAYDAMSVGAEGLAVRRARAKETLTTLDGERRTLDPEDLLVTDAATGTPLSLAGVMGGADSEVTEQTQAVVLEAACFDPISIARAARRHKLPSEASKRFERGVDPNLAPVAAQRAVDLLVELGGGTDASAGSLLEEIERPTVVRYPHGAASRLVGVDYTPEQVTGVLKQIGCTVTVGAETDEVTVPSWRPDLRTPEDLIEEVARIVGYDQIPVRLPVAPPGRGLTFEQASRRRVAELLAGAGLTEVLSYPFRSAAENALFEEPAPAITLVNPIDASHGQMRRLVLPGLLETARRNTARGFSDLALFEHGLVFRPAAEDVLGLESLPLGARRPDDETLARLRACTGPQPRHLAAVLSGELVSRQPDEASRPVDWRAGLDVARHAAHAVGTALTVRQTEYPGMHPGRTAELLLADGEAVGFAGELLPEVAAGYGLSGRVAVLELDEDALIAAAPRRIESHPLSVQTPATQDLSLVVPLTVPAGEVLRTVREGAGELLESAALTADYRGESIPEGSRSLTFALRFRAPDRTLTAAEASQARDAAAALASERFGATVRS